MIQKTFGAYHVVDKIGEGGMGEVYRAHDDRLNRDVAVKVLPEAFAHDADRLARFTREAQALGALNHPNIAQIYGFEEADGTPALVMEFVEGPTLADVVRDKATTPDGLRLPVSEVVGLAREIANGLEAAHERGIVHRDLKPANIKLTPDGHIKILDFGLAKAMAGDPTTLQAMNSPTLTARATEAGLILGTAAYMSPEQARGKAVDKRSDIWAFGAIVFELLTGERAFSGETVSDTLVSVLKADLEWSRLPPETPAYLRRLLARCLERDPSKRLRDIGEARLSFERGEGDHEAPIGVPTAAHATARQAPVVWFRQPLPWMATTAIFAVVTGAAWLWRPTPAPSSAFELSIAPPDGAEFQIGSNLGGVAVSPDGRSVAFIASTPQSSNSLWVRSLSQNDAHALPKSAGAYYPFWSPDSRQIGFFADSKLKTIEVASGLPEVVADASSGRGATWGEDGTILFTRDAGGAIVRVPAKGGQVVPVTHLDPSRGENAHYWPKFLPGDKTFAYFVRSVRPENNGIYVTNVDGSGTPTRLVTAMSSGIYAPAANGQPGALLWVRDGDLIAQPLDLGSRTLVGTVTTVASHVRVDEAQRGLLASVSRTGVLAWADSRAADMNFVLFDRDGRRLGQLLVDPGQLYQPAFSPGGSQVLFMRAANGRADIWLSDLAAGTTRQVTSDPGYSENGYWSPDGKQIAYLGTADGQSMLRVSPIDGATAPGNVTSRAVSSGLWTPDGRFLLYSVIDRGTTLNTWAQPIGQADRAVALTHEAISVTPQAFSPDGRWLALAVASATGGEVYFTRFLADHDTPRLGSQRVTLGPVGNVFWRKDGLEILTESIDGQVVSIPVSEAGETLAIGKPKALFKLPASGAGDWAASPDGTRFVVADAPRANGQSLHVLTNWVERLHK